MVVVAGETDWKVIAIDVTDPLANDLNGMCLVAVIGVCTCILVFEVTTVPYCGTEIHDVPKNVTSLSCYGFHIHELILIIFHGNGMRKACPCGRVG